MKVLIKVLGAALIVCVYSVPSQEQVQNALNRAAEINAAKRSLRSAQTRTLTSSPSKCPLARFHGKRSFTETEKEQRSLDVLSATRMLLDVGFIAVDLQHENVRSVFERQLVDCPSVATSSCDASAPFRTADGSCNNLNNPTWGMAGAAQIRLIGKNAYSDGISQPRMSGVDGQPLTNPRTISEEVHRGNTPREIPSGLTLHAFQMGQFLDHDFIETPTTTADCCTATVNADMCLPIRVQVGDSVFAENYCMNVPRSSATACSTSTDEATTTRSQLNQITSYIDASNVYGSSQTQQNELRDGAFMRTAQNGRRLPFDEDTTCISNPTQGIRCDLAGDDRVDTVPSLVAYHTLFVREHNRLATRLRQQISDDETLFQTVRKIIIGVMQKIVYDEFLPSFMSTAAIDRYGLSITANYQYDPTIDASIDSGFGIAFRFGHTWIPRNMSVFERNFAPHIEQNTEETYNNPALTFVASPTPGLEGLAWRLSAETSPETDRIIEEAARSRLFQTIDDEGNTYAFDLVALNINRGRDHGLPSYNEFRKWCQLSSYESWPASNTLSLADHDVETSNRLRKVYNSPQDIDLFTGVVSERPVTGSTIGPTLECILGVQFRRLKFGDRFWYQGNAAAFTQAQLSAIRNYTMANIQCINYNFASIQYPNVFVNMLRHDFTPCTALADIDASLFVP